MLKRLKGVGVEANQAAGGAALKTADDFEMEMEQFQNNGPQ